MLRGPAVLPVVSWWLLFGASTQALAFAPLFPRLRDELALSSGDLGWLTGGYTLVFALTTLASATARQRWGAHRLLAAAVLLLGVGLLLLPLLDSRPALLAARLATAMGHALLTPTIVLSLARRGAAAQFRLTGWVLTGHACAHLVGVPLLVALAETGVDPTLLLAAVGLLPLGLWPLLDCFRESAEAPVQSPPTDDARASWKSLWTRQPTRFLLLGALLATAATSSFVLYFPLLLTERHPDASLPLWLFAAGLGQTLAVAAGGRWAARGGLRPVLLGSAFGSIAVLIGLAALPSAELLFGVGFVLLSALSGLRAAPLQAGITQLSTRPNRPAATALLNALHQLGRTGGSVGGLLLLASPGLLRFATAGVLAWLLAAVFFVLASGFPAPKTIRAEKTPALARGMQDEDVQ